MDTLQAFVIVSLVAMAVISVILWLRQWRHLFQIRRTGKIGVMNLKDAAAFVIMIPTLLAGVEGAFWIYRKGWEDFPKVESLALLYGFVGAVFMVICFYVINRHALSMIKKIEILNLHGNRRQTEELD
jgi:hypothetical protein